MSNKNTFLEQALTLFTQYGCKRVSMNDLAHALGVSKKTLYAHFKHKDELVLECVSLLLRRSHTKMSRFFYNAKPSVDPIKSITHIYRIALKELRNLSPTFIYSLKKYYQNAYKLYEDFRQKIVWTYILNLLEQAKNRGQVRENINLKLICELFLLRIDDIILPHSDFFNSYTTE